MALTLLDGLLTRWRQIDRWSPYFYRLEPGGYQAGSPEERDGVKTRKKRMRACGGNWRLKKISRRENRE